MNTYLIKRLKRLCGSNAGFTLVEVLVASLIASFAIAAGMQLLITQNEAHLTQEGITAMQQNGRATADELVNKIRLAGYRIEPGIQCLYSWNSNPDTIAVVFMAEPLCTASLSVAMTQPSSIITCEDSDVSCLNTDSWAYIYDAIKDSGEFFYVTGVNSSAGEIQHNTANLSKAYPQGAKVFTLDFYKYFINASDTLHSYLAMTKNGSDPVIYADNILDLQFKYVQANGAVLDSIAVDRYVRQIDITIVSRTDKNDLFMDDYRYDTLTASAMVRNLGL